MPARAFTGGRLDADGVFYQANLSALVLCWDSPGFADSESGIWKLEWQLARLVHGAWDTITATQQLDEFTAAAIASSGRLVVSRTIL